MSLLIKSLPENIYCTSVGQNSTSGEKYQYAITVVVKYCNLQP